MSRDTVNAICAALPAAEVSDPWGGGHDCWKVGGKSFAIMGSVSPGVAIKTDSAETAEMLIEAGAAWRDKYLRGAWVKMSWDRPEDELRERLLASYRLIRAGLTKKVQAGLGEV
ncbi:MAG: MmcQ/YjbR family DNA-binding protein [Asticcacaulis sp.]